jgi:hypothetical protein
MKAKTSVQTVRMLGIAAILAAVVISMTGCGEDKHTHSYGTAWKSNDTQHWHECVCGEKSYLANHDWETLSSVAPTCTSEGHRTIKCKTCGEETVDHISALGHSYNWVVTSTTYPAVSTGTCARDSAHTDTRSTIIGDTGPAGGVIFYVDAAGFTVLASPAGTPAANQWAAYTAHYLEAALADEAKAEWGDYGTLIPNVTTFTELTDPLASAIGIGRKDTQVIVNHLEGKETERAAQLCAAKTTGGKTDWFLPSCGELNKMYEAKGKPNIPTSGYYWSSSQRSNTGAWVQLFSSYYQVGMVKDASTDNFRAIRAF